MNIIIENLPTFMKSFGTTVELWFCSAVLATVLGIFVATCRVSPVKPLRVFGGLYVGSIRNTPLPVIFFLLVFGLPEVGISIPFFAFSVLALGVYTSAFIAEVLRSGIQAVGVGQSEASRSLGLSFGEMLSRVVMPQAARNVVAPLGNVYIACIKNSSVAMAFGVFEATSAAYTLSNAHGGAVMFILAAVAVGYLILTSLAAAVVEFIEHRVRIVQ
jgi:glutamate transport system permease protein